MRFRLLAFVMFAFAGAVLMLPKQTDAAATVSPELITRIKTHCIENQATLNRLHQTDAFLRTDRGNLYRTISDKLMTPLNRRLASNKLDGGTLLTIASDYDTQYNKFYDAYIDYDNALSKILKIDCSEQPVAFYNGLLDAREKRAELSKINTQIKDYIRQYGKSFADFKQSYKDKS